MASLRNVFTMEHVRRTVISAVILMLVLPLATCDADEKLTGQQSLLLTHAVKTLLGFSDLPPREKGVLPTPGDMGAASRYMVEMYNRHKRGAFTKGQQTGNTVRSIHADIGVLNGERVFLFNLSSIKTSESVFSGELHFYKPRRHNDDTSISMHIYEVAPMYMSHVQVVPVHSRSVGWQVVDVTSSLSSCLATNRNLPHLLAVTFLAEQRDGDLTSLSLKKFMKYLSMPFLVVFANETQTLTMDHLDPYFIPLSSKEKIGETIRDQGIAEDDSGKSDELINPESSKYNRRKRSVLDNRIPDDPREIPKSNVAHQMPETHPSMLSGRITSRYKIPKTVLSANNVKSGLKKSRSRQRVTERLTNKQKSRLLPPPEFYGPTNRRRQRHRRRRKYRRRRLPVPKDWQRENVSAPRGDRQRRCSRRRLVVDFMDIGWGEWIISPKSFSANYCAGECRFPLSKKMKPSNHATIQSIVKAVGLYKGIPAPCCVPDVMSSVTLLYFDESKNVVLKNYPGMSVESCACR